MRAAVLQNTPLCTELRKEETLAILKRRPRVCYWVFGNV